ncbi:MAG: phospholipase/carboxylesterase [Acidobacteriota bacterium]|nr:phospholipase/carboxylesterase [Acidobacteriota bacterium]
MTNHADPTESVERSVAVASKLYYDLYAPSHSAPAPLLVALHGYGSNKSWMMREARQFTPEGFTIAAPQGFHQHLKEPREKGAPLRYGFGWLTNFRAEESVALHHRALVDLISNIIEEKIADPSRVFLFGFSQSCALNYRFAFTHAGVLRGTVGVCGGLPGDWETSEAYRETQASVLHLAGTRDEFYPPERTADYAARLLARARDVEFKSYDAGHELVPAMREDIRAWLASRAGV